MKRKPAVLIIENSIDVTGALKSITRTAYDLKKYFNFQFVIPSNSRGRFWIERKDFTAIHEMPMKEISRSLFSLVFYLPLLAMNTIRLGAIVKRQKIDLIHVNDLYNLLPVVYRWFGGAIPYVCHIRLLPDKFPKILFDFWWKLHLRNASKIIVVSHAVMKQLPHHSKITVIHNELPVEERYPELIEPERNRAAFTFLYLSNFMTGKGQNFALEAFAKIHRTLPNWKLRFVGGDMGLIKNQAYRKSLQKRAMELGIFEKTEWIGFTEAVDREYKQSDIMLNFSESESFSITCLESLYFGCPVIATDCGGPAEIIEQNKTGYLVGNKNVEEMSQAMLLLAKDEGLRLQMGVEAMLSVRKKFSIENTSYKMRSVYELILNN